MRLEQRYFLLKVSYNFFIDYLLIRSYYGKKITNGKQTSSELNIHREGVVAFLDQPGIVIVKWKFLAKTLSQLLIACLDKSHLLEGTFLLLLHLQTGLTSLFLLAVFDETLLLVSNIALIDLYGLDCRVFVGILDISKLLPLRMISFHTVCLVQSQLCSCSTYIFSILVTMHH